ncbi:VWA domain-containing protein [Candidatus Sumerlaeota bacterium]|nr:VWA domain-containing protein [Candidatus Sumerlaeota bacterium]
MNKHIARLTIMAVIVSAASFGHAAGILTPLGSGQAPIQIQDHHVNVVINNGFAQTEVTQTFTNPNAERIEAIYSFPLPKSASLSEVTLTIGEREIHGEVIERKEAERIYEEEKNQGNDAGLANKNEYKTFEFRVSGIEPNSEARIRFVYYQPIEIDSGVGRFVYPLADGGTDELAESFWSVNEKVEGAFSIEVELKTAWPVTSVRTPGYENETSINQIADGHYQARFEQTQGALTRDFVFYYMLRDDLPGRVEMLTYKADAEKPGTFMMILTPGLDLEPLTEGTDYVFTLDVSGSMDQKIHMLTEGVKRAIGQLNPNDRFCVVVFNDNAKMLTRGWTAATPDNVAKTFQVLDGLRANGGTNLFDGLMLGLKQLDADRATNFILVTDAVTNQGELSPKKFHELMKTYDVRFFGFLIGNNANWPLMRVICEGSDGFAREVSTSDDIIGQIALAKSKVGRECLHDAELKISGVKTFNTTDQMIGRVHFGQQLIIFGQYADGGEAALTLKTRQTGEDKTYKTSVQFPDVAVDHPELERLWALSQIEQIELQENIGLTEPAESRSAIVDLGLNYQLVTDHTSMLVLSDDKFENYGVKRLNKERTALEHEAQARRKQNAASNYRVDNQSPMFQRQANHMRHTGGGSGAGAFDPITAMIVALLTGAGVTGARSRKQQG